MTITLIFEIFQDKIKKFGLTKFSKKSSNIYLFGIDFLVPILKFQRIHDNPRYTHRHRADGPWQTLHHIHKLIEHKMALRHHM